MRLEGIIAECIFPTIGLYVWGLEDAEAGAASCRIYNEWIADALGKHPRFSCAGIVPTWTVEGALAEIEWIVDAGLGSIMLPTLVEPAWNHASWASVWRTIAESGLPAIMHQGTGHSMYFYRGPGAGVSNLIATQSMGPRTAALLATSGVLAANPDLHVVLVEYNGGWLAWTMQTVDYYTEAFGRYGTTASGKPWINPSLPEPPSEYIRRQVHATFQDDPVAVANLSYTGTDVLMWGSDYPHEEGTYPRSREVVNRLTLDLSDAQRRAVFHDNAVRVFGFGPAVLASVP
jgi:predicted TIM-barrel fold metal-dependent hydrolase